MKKAEKTVGITFLFVLPTVFFIACFGELNL